VLGQNIAVEYHVVEMPGVCKAGREMWRDDPRVSFSSSMPAATEKFDLVYSWGSIHYLPDPLDLMRSFTAYDPQAILIVGSPFADKAFVRGQVNQSVPFPGWVIGLPDAERIMQESGYALTLKVAGDEIYNVENFDEAHRVAHSASLLFQRLVHR
jgi:putative methyltransferase (TIGR04325 family)